MELMRKIEPNRENLRVAEMLIHDGRHSDAVDLITRLIEVCPWSPRLRELRAEAHTVMGDYMNAISDIRSTTKLLSDNTQGFFKLSALLYRLGHVDDSLKLVDRIFFRCLTVNFFVYLFNLFNLFNSTR